MKRYWWRVVTSKLMIFPRSILLAALVLGITIVGLLTSPARAWAALNDDRFDGDIFALYAGNGALVPPKISLEASLKQAKPTLLVIYADDSSDSKRYSTTVSQTQALYGRAINIIALRVDAIANAGQTQTNQPGYYYKGLVPQTVIFDQSGQVRLNETGNIAFEAIDDVFRQVFDLLPRSQSAPLKRRPVNEFNSELVK